MTVTVGEQVLTSGGAEARAATCTTQCIEQNPQEREKKMLHKISYYSFINAVLFYR